MESTGGSLRPAPSGGARPRRCFALRFTNSYSFSPPPNDPNEETQKHAASRRKAGREQREKTQSAPQKQDGGKKRSRKTEKGAGWDAPLVSPRPNRRSKHKKSKEHVPLSPLLCDMYAKHGFSSALKRTKSCTGSQNQHSRRSHKRSKQERKRTIAESVSPSLQNRRQDQHRKRTWKQGKTAGQAQPETADEKQKMAPTIGSSPIDEQTARSRSILAAFGTKGKTQPGISEGRAG